MKPIQLSDQMIDQIVNNLDESKLGKWEFDFFTSIKTWWKKNRRLSEKQKNRLAELWSAQHDPSTPKS
jgi:hypothetical protein